MAGLVHRAFTPAGIQYLDFMQMGVMLIDENNRIVYWNRWLENHSNIAFEDIANRSFVEAFPELANSRLDDVIHQALEEKLSALISASLNQSLLPLYPSINHHLKQIDLMRQMVQVSSISDDKGRRYALVQVTNMTHVLAKEVQLRAQTQTIQDLVNVDALTSVANRRKYDSSLQEEFSRAQRAGSSLVIGFVDIDYFKLFNDHYGVSYGDRCLSEVAGSFEYALNRSTDVVARYSGQVFGIIMPCTTFEGAVSVAEALRSGVQDLQLRHEASSIASHVTVSIGLATMQPISTDKIDVLIEAAEFALDQAKKSGGNKAMIYAMQDGSLHACDALFEVKQFVEA
jgi:diguanylate cyclase (GGDEF)-like protein